MIPMFWLVKALLVLGKTRRGRKLIFATSLAVMEVAQSEQARKLYAKAAHDTRGAARAIRHRRWR